MNGYCPSCQHPGGYHDPERGCSMPLSDSGLPVGRGEETVRSCGCGKPNEFNGYVPESDEESAFLRAYDPSKFPITVVTVDLILTRFTIVSACVKRLEVLLIKRGNWPYKGYWALPGGFIDPQETTEEAARRELHEEAGVSVPECDFRFVADKPDRDPRGRAISHVFRSHTTLPMEHRAGDDAADAQWFSVDDVLTYGGMEIPMAFDHLEILKKEFA